MQAQNADALNALMGAKAIAEFIYGDASEDKKVYKLAERGEIPIFRLGALLCARKASIIAWIEAQERTHRQPRPAIVPPSPRRNRRR